MKDKVKKGGAAKSQGTSDVPVTCSVKVPVGIKQEEDTSFPVKIQGAGVEPFEMQVHGFWLVQDAVMALMAKEEVCPRSNLSLALSGMTLDPLAELQTLKGLKPGSSLRLVEEPYSPRSARVHLGRVLELLRATGPQDALKDGCSPSVLDTLTYTPTAESGSSNGKSLKRSSSNTKSEPANQDGGPPEHLLPGSPERPLMALLPHSSQPEVPSYLRDLSLSCWNPPPGHRKLQGDFLYITVFTLEGRRYDITSCPKGFYLNRSTEEVFDPRPAQSSSVCHCLTDLLCHISPSFKKALITLKTRPQQPPVEVLPTPYRTRSWLGPSCASRTHRNAFSRLGLDDQATSQVSDWNEELQAARDLPQGSLEERLHRDKALLQVNSAFVFAVTQGAETVMDGFVEPINGNPEDPAFLWSGLFMSQGAASAALGGERGRRAAQRLELNGVQLYNNLEGGLQGLHTLPTATVDYRGVRLSAQGLAPGLEGQEGQESAPAARGLLYGVNAGPQESPQRRQLLALLAQSAKALSLQRHAVVAPNGHQVPLFTSVDAQGLVGADGRFYLLDLFRTLPADANYCTDVPPVPRDETEQSSGATIEEGWPVDYHTDTGLPKSFPHGLCRLRPELLQDFIQHKHLQFTERVKERMEEIGGLEECATAGDSRAQNTVRAACKDVGSVSDIIFEMRFNPNIFTPGISFPGGESSAVELQERLLREAAAFVITHQIPSFVEYCLQNNEVPVDGASLKQALHRRGINLRYLGHVVKAISQLEHKERLRHILRVVTGEIVVRSARRIFNSFLQGVEVSSLSTAVSHFLCCLLVHHFSPPVQGEETKKKSRRRGRAQGSVTTESTPWSMLTGAELWTMIEQDSAETYDFANSLTSGPTHVVEQYGVQKLSLLREFCLKTGIQLRLRDYFLDQSKAPIGPDDIINIFPVVKHLDMPIVDASKAFGAAQKAIQKGLLDQAHERLKESAYLFGRVCDDLHPEACHCLSLLAKVAFLQGQVAEARSVQLKAVVVSERVLGFDHPNTIHQYVLLAVYVYGGGENTLAQKCLYRARQLMLTVHGEDHPYTATLDSCLGLILPGEQGGPFLQNALKLNSSFFGPADLRTALSHHLLSQWMCSKGDYRSAMNHEKEALAAFTSMFGEDHPQTRCSSEFLSTITQQAVRVERCLRQAAADQTEHTIECLTPATDTILEQMVLVTGIRKNAQNDRLQEFKQKLLAQRAAEATEEANKVNDERANAVTEKGDGKSSDNITVSLKDDASPVTDNSCDSQADPSAVESSDPVTVNGHAVETVEAILDTENTLTESDNSCDGQADPSAVESSNPVTVNGHAVEPVEAILVTENTLTESDNSSDSQADQSVEKASVESSDQLPVNGHAMEPVEQTLDKENTLTEPEESCNPASQAELTDTAFRSTGEETRTPNANEDDSLTENEGIAIEVMTNGVDESDTEGANDGINGYLDITAELSELDNQGALADIGLPKASIANGVGEKDIAVNGVAEPEATVTANGLAEE